MKLKIQFPPLQGELAAQYFLSEGHERPTLIFLHDSLGCIKTWRDFPKELAEMTSCNYLVYDRLGYGDSSNDLDALKKDKGYLEKEADILLKLIDHLKIKNPILFGHSDGGSIALIAASKSEDKIKGIIVEAAHIFVETITLEGIRKMKADFQKGELRKKLLKYHGSKVDEVFGSWANTWLSSNFQDWNIESYLPKINCPCIILQGLNDEYGTLDQVKGIKSGINGKAKEVILENVGHNPHRENRAYTLKMTTSFINNLSVQ